MAKVFVEHCSTALLEQPLALPGPSDNFTSVWTHLYTGLYTCIFNKSVSIPFTDFYTSLYSKCYTSYKPVDLSEHVSTQFFTQFLDTINYTTICTYLILEKTLQKKCSQIFTPAHRHIFTRVCTKGGTNLFLSQ